MTSPFFPASPAPPLPAPATPKPPGRGDPKEREAILRERSVEFEAAFLGEMLKSAGFGKARDSFGGGAGEDAFSGMLVNEQARLLARKGGIGLAEHVFRALMRHEPPAEAAPEAPDA